MLDVPARELIVWRGPRADGTWKERRVHAENERIAVPGTEAELTVAELLAD